MSLTICQTRAAASDATHKLLQAIGECQGRGWSLIPLRPGSKLPAIPWAEHQRRQHTPDELEDWYEADPAMNYGIVTGTVSGIFVIDCDSADAVAWASEHLPPTELRVRTPKGLHLYFPYSGDRALRNKTRVMYRGRSLEIDVRGEGGYVVGPWSVHPSGARYVPEGSGWWRIAEALHQ